MSKFNKIGSAEEKESIKGTKYLSITFDEDVLDKVCTPDLLKKICIFRNETGMSVMAPTLDSDSPAPKKQSEKKQLSFHQ